MGVFHYERPTDKQAVALAFVFHALTAAAMDGLCVLHHGDCVGADALAHDIAQEIGWRIVVHPPLNAAKRAFCGLAAGDLAREPLDYLERNQAIIDETPNGLISVPSGPEKRRSGEWATTRYARRAYRAVLIIWPSGRIDQERGPDIGGIQWPDMIKGE